MNPDDAADAYEDDSVIMNPDPDDASEIAAHGEHEGYSVFRFGAGDLVDIHISCDECDIRWIIEDVPKDKAENPGKYMDRD